MPRLIDTFRSRPVPEPGGIDVMDNVGYEQIWDCHGVPNQKWTLP